MSNAVDLFIVLYFIGLNLTYGLYLVLSSMEMASSDALRLTELDHLTLRTDSTPPVSILVPAFNEVRSIVDSVRALLQLEYPRFEIIVINDGSSDDTMAVLTARFDLVKLDRPCRRDLATQAIRHLYRSRIEPRLIVIDKENGGKADALNAGVNVSRAPLLCCVDADSILVRRALLRLVEPFIYGDGSVMATGGTVRLINGSAVKDGSIRKIQLPDSWIARFQIVEYLRAFLFARLGLNRLGGNLIISGAMGLFKRQVLVDIGGYQAASIGEDMELIVRIHRHMRQQKRPYQIRFIPDPVCYTEAPVSLKVLGRQRDRWQRGLADSLWRHRRMILNPRYGIVGLVTIPLYLVFELLAPLVELFGYAWAAVAVAEGRVDFTVAALIFLIAFLLGFLFSLQALIADDLTFRNYPDLRARLWLVASASLENFGYRQVLLLYRTRGLFRFLWGARGWGTMQKKGFSP